MPIGYLCQRISYAVFGAVFYNTFHFSESTHKRLHIGITVLFQNIGQLIQLNGDFLFRLLYLPWI